MKVTIVTYVTIVTLCYAMLRFVTKLAMRGFSQKRPCFLPPYTPFSSINIYNVLSSIDKDNPLPTMIATNRDITQLPARVVDRFRDSQISALVLNEAKSYRGEK